MAKSKSKNVQSTSYRHPVRAAKATVATVPCHTIHVAGSAVAAKEMTTALSKRKGRGTRSAAACAVGVSRFALPVDARGVPGKRDVAQRPELGFSTKAIPCKGSLKRRGCPAQVAFQNGKPYLRFCFADKQPGYRIDIEDPIEANRIASEVCTRWAKNKRKFKFPQGAPLGRLARRG